MLLGFISVANGQINNNNLQKLLDDFRSKNDIGAASIAISFPNETSPRLFFSGTIAKSSEQKLNIGNLSQVNSITKSFIAVTTLKLQERGLLSLNDTLEQWLPEYSRWKLINLRQLMNHTSGIYNYTDVEAFRQILLTEPSHYFSPNELINYAHGENDYFMSGQGWHYSNTNYVLLGQIIEKASGVKIEELINDLIKSDYIFLNNTRMVSHLLPNNFKERIVHGYLMINQTQFLDTTDFSYSWQNTAGYMVSNSYDVVQWIRVLFSGQLLKKNSIDEFYHLVSQMDGQPLEMVSEHEPDAYGLGMMVWSSDYNTIGTVWWHSGGGIGYKSLMMWLPNQKISIAIQYNKVNISELNDPFSPKKDFPRKILQLIEDDYFKDRPLV